MNTPNYIKLIVSTVFLSSLQISAYAQENCAAGDVYSHQQCSFSAPAIGHNQSRLVETKSDLGFSGTVGVACRNGKLQWGEATCEPKEKSSCSIPATRFSSAKGTCSHVAHPVPLANGAERLAYADVGTGTVTYTCEDGKLQAFDPFCGGESAALGIAIKSTVTPVATLSAQSATTLKTANFKFSIYNESHAGPAGNRALMSEAISRCSAFSGYTPGVQPTIEVEEHAGKGNYTITCPLAKELTCDEDIVLQGMHGQMDPSRGEQTIPPSAAQFDSHCKARGYQGATDVIALSLASEYIVDIFNTALVCSGKSSNCGPEPVKTSQTTLTPVNCTTANLKVTNAKRPKGSPPDTALMTSWCASKSFGSFSSASDFTVVDEFGGFAWYDTTLTCTNYTGTVPLMNGCGINGDDTLIPPSGLQVDRLDCDTAHVSATYNGEPHPINQDLIGTPSRATIESSCKTTGYAILDSIISTEIVDEGGKGAARRFYITALCTNYTGDKSNCNAQDPCLGNQVLAGSQKPHRCMPDGKCYENLCSDPVTPGADFCKDCDGAQGTFTHAATGNTCTVVAPLLKSGASQTFNFANSQYNGEATMKCNNGTILEAGGTCYKTCPGGVTLGWADKNGVNSCTQVVPNGIHKQDSPISFSSSINHTGTAGFKCNNGNWVQTSANCQLDCSGSISWGSGTAANGVNKTGLCKANLSPVRHGTQGNNNSITANTSGATAHTCNNGVFDLSGSSCNVGCAAQSVSWGGQCRANLSGTSHTQSVPVSHSSNSGYAFASTISGNATFRCTDGGVALVSGTCKYVTSLREAAWGGWGNTGSPHSCSGWTPSPSTIDYGTPFTQTRSCSQDQTRSRTVYNVWNDGSETFNRTDTDAQTISVGQSNPSTGTRDFITGEEPSSWSGWSNNGGVQSCSSWGPSTVDYPSGQSFTQTQTCQQPQSRSRTINYVWKSGARTYKTTEFDSRTVSVSDSRPAIGTKAKTEVSRSCGSYSGWNDSGGMYGCSSFSPSTSTVAAGTMFSQSRNCSQNQTSSCQVTVYWSDGTTSSGGSQSSSRTVSVTDSQYAIGTKAPPPPPPQDCPTYNQLTGIWTLCP